MQRFITAILCITLISSLVGCATTYDRGEGIIVAEKKIKDKDYKPHQNTQTGAIVGGSIGAAGGAVWGGLTAFPIGVVYSLLTNNAMWMFAFGAGGAVAGAVIAGAAGAAVGGGVGYAADTAVTNAGLYQYIVKSSHEERMTITQYSAPIPLNTPVLILEKNKLIYIKQKK